MPKNRIKTHRRQLLSAFAAGFFILSVFWFLPALSAQLGGGLNRDGLISRVLHIENAAAGTAVGAKVEADARADAQKNAGGGIRGFIAKMIGALALLLISIEGGIIYFETEILMALMSYNGFVVSPAVNIGWTLMRDISNLFFVLILLVIAIGTILHIESYNFKRLLPKVIIMAVLINFSRTICGLIIDFAQVIMMTFAAAFAGIGGAGNLYKVLQIDKIIQAAQPAAEVAAGGPTAGTAYQDKPIELWEVAASAVLAVILLLIAIIVILVILVVIILRVVMLWLLVVLSPLAYIMAAFPQGQRYAQQWWQEFSKYVIIGPVLAFFLWLTFAIASGQGGIDTKEMGLDPAKVGQGTEEKNPSFLTAIGESQVMLQFIIAIGMLMGGLMITQQMGVAGSGFAGSMYNKIRGAGLSAAALPWKAAKRGISTGEKLLYGKTGIGLSPARVYRKMGERYAGWEKRMESEGAGAGLEKARGLIQSESKIPGLGAAKRALGVGGMYAAATSDAVQEFNSIRGIGHMLKIIFKGTSDAEEKKWHEDQKSLEDNNARKEKLTKVKDVTEKGKEELTGRSVENMMALDASMIASEKQKAIDVMPDHAGAYADMDALLNDLSPKDLDKLKKSAPGEIEGAGINVDAAGKATKGLSEDSEREKVKQVLARQQAEKLMKEGGTYVDAKGAVNQATAADFKKHGEEYYDKEKKRMDDELARLATPTGITDQQLVVRQRTLEDVDRQILKVLKEIKARGGTGIGDATDQEAQTVADLVAKGKDLGGTATASAMAGFERFGTGADLTTPVVKINHANVTKRGKAEEDELSKKNEIGQNRLEQLREDRRDLSQAATLATMAPARRQAEQTRIQGEVDAESLRIKAQDREVKSKAVHAPMGYEAMAALRAAEGEEMRKLPPEMEWTEIESELRSAQKLKNKSKMRALIKKAAMDANDNEVWNAFGYSSDAKGMRDFGDKVLVGEQGWNKQEMLKFMNDVAYINEDKGHKETARMVKMEGGTADWNSEAEHAAAIANENLKAASRAFLQNTNRLGFGGEMGGKFSLSLSGKLTLAGLGDGELQNRVARGEFNPSTLSKLATDAEGLRDMVSRGWLSQRTVDMIIREAQKKSISAGYGQLLSQAKRAGYE